jgi:hypothetical protein
MGAQRFSFGTQVHVRCDRFVDSKHADFVGCDGIAMRVDNRGKVVVALPDGSVSRFHQDDLDRIEPASDERRERIATFLYAALFTGGGPFSINSDAPMAAASLRRADALIAALDAPIAPASKEGA